jgi:hypothetical protein
MEWCEGTNPPHDDEQRPQRTVHSKDGSSSLVPNVVVGDRAKTCKIAQQLRPQAGIARHHPCSTKVRPPHHRRRRKEVDPTTSEGLLQGMLPQQLSPIQSLQWPLEKHLMTAQIAPKPSQHRQDQIRALHNL